jgi:hypothetical protein
VLRVLKGYAPFDPAALNDLELARIDRKVIAAMENATTAPRRDLRGFLWGGTFAVAAAAAVVLSVLPDSWLGPTEPAPLSLAPSSPGRGFVLAAGLDAHASNAGGALLKDTPSGEVTAGMTLGAGSGTVTVQTGPATGVHLTRGELHLSRLDAGRTELRLLSGEVLAEVKPLSPGATFEIRCHDLLVAVRGTAFLVQRLAGATVVEVSHGLVQVTREETLDAVLVPGLTRIEIADGASLAAAQPMAADRARAELPLGFLDVPLSDLSATTKPLRLQSNPSGARVWVDGRFRGLTPLSVLASDGAHAVRFEAEGRPPLETTLATSSPSPVAILPQVPPTLSKAAAQREDAPREAVKTFAPTSIKKKPLVASLDDPRASRRQSLEQRVLLRREELEACYRKAMQGNANLSGEVDLMVTFGPKGTVREIAAGERVHEIAAGDKNEQRFLDCASAILGRGPVAGTGEEETMVIPLRFSARP